MNPTLGLKNAVLMGLIVSYFVVVGADMYAQAAIAWTVLEAPPRSLSMFQGAYVYDGAPFWRVTTSLTLVLFVLALAVNWATTRRRLLLISFGAFFMINIVSFVYIFPEYIDIVSSAYSDTIDPALQGRGTNWRRIALLRWFIVVLCGLPILGALAKPAAFGDAPGHSSA